MDPAVDVAAAQYAVQQLQTQHQQMVAEMNHLRAEGQAAAQALAKERAEAHHRGVAAAAAAAAGALVAAAPVRDQFRPKIPMPTTFAGAIGTIVEDWIQSIEKQFSYYEHTF